MKYILKHWYIHFLIIFIAICVSLGITALLAPFLFGFSGECSTLCVLSHAATFIASPFLPTQQDYEGVNRLRVVLLFWWFVFIVIAVALWGVMSAVVLLLFMTQKQKSQSSKKKRTLPI